MYDFVMFTCIGYKLPTFWEYMSIGEDSVRPLGAGLRNVHFLIMHTSIGYKPLTVVEYMSPGGIYILGCLSDKCQEPPLDIGTPFGHWHPLGH